MTPTILEITLKMALNQVLQTRNLQGLINIMSPSLQLNEQAL